MITTHKFIDKYPISPDSKHLIIGTIHAPSTDVVDFFYGSSVSIWRIFKECFPNIKLDPNNLDSILAFLSRNKVSVTDTIKKCDRIDNSALDSKLIPIEFNTNLVEQLLNSKIEHLYFTSGFGKNNAFRLFYINILGKKYVEDKLKKQREFNLSISDRIFKCHILYSPSGSANRAIARSIEYKISKEKFQDTVNPVNAFRIENYQKVFPFLK
jgi:hypothetical protein